MSVPTSKYAEQLIEAQIIQGIFPNQAIINVVSPFINVNDKDRLEILLGRSSFPGYFNKVLEKFSIIRDLGLSNEFLQRYFIYPSGRGRPPMTFVHRTISDLVGKSVIVSSPEDKRKPTYFFDGENLRDLPCLVLLDGPVYIPVIRYEASGGKGLVPFKTEYNTETHCGTYYYYEPGSDVFLLSNKTLIAPLPEIAYYHLAGDDAINKLSSIIFPFGARGRFSPGQQNYINDFLYQVVKNQCSTGMTGMTGMSGNYTYNSVVNAKSIEPHLCMLARQTGIDVIIITYTMSLGAGKYNDKYGSSEINDARIRTTSYDSLYKMETLVV
ncbi:Hypothetical protein HVR_LOCUS309 [uncultured virus]|nr:Hypothetical protein HVR_LOCUS309 [uncultured virus]